MPYMCRVVSANVKIRSLPEEQKVQGVIISAPIEVSVSFTVGIKGTIFCLRQTRNVLNDRVGKSKGTKKPLLREMNLIRNSDPLASDQYAGVLCFNSLWKFEHGSVSHRMRQK